MMSQWHELHMSRTNFHGPKDILAIEVCLYKVNFDFEQSKKRGGCFSESTVHGSSAVPL